MFLSGNTTNNTQKGAQDALFKFKTSDDEAAGLGAGIGPACSYLGC